MKSKLASIAFTLFALFGLVGVVAAGPVVQVGSSYSVYIEGADSANSFSAAAAFNGLPKSFMRAGLNLWLTESDTDLGAGRHRIAIDLRADGDLFPVPGEQGYMGVGTYGDGLDLLALVSLDDARIRLYDLPGNVRFESLNLANTTQLGNPWDGLFPGLGAVIGIGAAGGIGVSHLMFEFQVSTLGAAVPEPGGLLLLGAALVSLGTVRRRRGASRRSRRDAQSGKSTASE